MTAATIRASAVYRKRQAAKMQRYEAALREIVAWRGFGDDLPGVDMKDIARAALQEPSDA